MQNCRKDERKEGKKEGKKEGERGGRLIEARMDGVEAVALARHAFAIGLPGPMSSSGGRESNSRPFKVDSPRDGEGRKQEAGRGERASESGWGSSERAGETQIDRDARSLTPLTTETVHRWMRKSEL